MTDLGQLSEQERDLENDRTQKMPVLRWESFHCRTGDYLTSWMSITRGNGKNGYKCRVFMESKLYSSDYSEADKEKIKKDLIEAWNKRYKED